VTVNPATNKIYVPNQTSNNMTVIDGTNNSTTTVSTGLLPQAAAVNLITNKIYVTNQRSNDVTVITPAPTNAIPLNTTITPVAGNTVNTPTSTFTLTATSTHSPNAPPPQNIYYQVDTLINPFLLAAKQSSTATTLTANAVTPPLQPGLHIIYFFAADGSEATSINPARPFEEKFSEGFNTLAPESSPIIGGINAYLFLVTPSASSCSFVINPTSQSFTSSGGNGSTTVTTDNGCAWSSSSNDSWITVTEGASGSGNGTVSFTVAANSGAARTGTITVAGQTFTVNQTAAVKSRKRVRFF
jgi:YVTN family beta-propeller protein